MFLKINCVSNFTFTVDQVEMPTNSKGGTKGFKKGASADNPDRIKSHAGQRDRGTIQRLQMYKGGKAIRNPDGKIIGGTLMRTDRYAIANITYLYSKIEV